MANKYKVYIYETFIQIDFGEKNDPNRKRYIYTNEVIEKSFNDDLKFIILKSMYYDKLYSKYKFLFINDSTEYRIKLYTYRDILNMYYNGEEEHNNG